MAVRQRLFNSTAPFSGSGKVELKGSYPSCSPMEQETEDEEEEGKLNKMGYRTVAEWETNYVISKLLSHGTAEQIGAHERPSKTSIIAQAECETQDSQEFSPSCSAPCYVRSTKPFSFSPCSEPNNVACSTTASVHEPCTRASPFIPTQKSRKRQKKKVKKNRRHRTPSGVPEQESGSSLGPILEELSLTGSNLSTSCCSSSDSSVGQEQESCPYGSSCSPLTWPERDLHPLLSYEQDNSSDSLSTLENCSLALAGLRGCVSQGDRCFARPFFKDVERDARVYEDELAATDSAINEGLIFYNEKMNPVDSEYKEGSEYVLSQFIKEGSYGEVYSAKDVKTGFTFAVKKIAMKRFNVEEVGAWSALRSPRVVELFGVVREGPCVVFLMDHKSGSLGDLIVERGRLPEDLSLHYHSQVLTALEYLVKKKVAHLDIKADNVLLSEDGRNSFICDFGHAERLDNRGLSLSDSKDLKGTETHMAPEIVKGDPRGAKADVWSVCCMLLHMLNGCQPWTRYYTCRLYLKIANDPPPLREIPPDCNPFTAEVLKAGLQKDPMKRFSASELKEKANRALKEVGGLLSPIKGPYREPLYVVKEPSTSLQLINNITDLEDERDHQKFSNEEIEAGLKAKKQNDSKEIEFGYKESKRGSLGPQMLISDSNQKRCNKINTVPELELRKLENDFYLSSLSQLHSAEMQEQFLSCLSSDHYSNWEPWDKKDSGRWSLSPGENFSSGVYSFNSQPDVPVFSLDFSNRTHVPPSCCFEGVDVCIRDFSNRSIQIRETRRVKVGHIATGISDQISERVFTLETPQGLPVAHDEEVKESGLEFCCVPAPDFSSAWTWRIRDGVLQTK